MDVAIVGSGLIGLACARELAAAGLEVAVVEGQERPASWAAAGILGPQSEAHGPGPSFELGWKSLQLWPKFVEGLGDVGFVQCGTQHTVPRDVSWMKDVPVEHRERGVFFPAEATVDNRRLLGALRERVKIVRETPKAKQIVLCAGAWSGKLAPLDVYPVRGQLLALDSPPPQSIVFGHHCYAVPRRDRVIIGATGEEVGFDGSTTTEARDYLLGVAEKLGVQKGRILEHWAGLRPATRDGLPYLGRLQDGRIAATGHFRNGILLAPITAAIVRALVLGETPPVDLLPFSPSRRTS